jgi:hypothetical protein
MASLTIGPSESLHGVRDGAIVGTNDSDLTHLSNLQPEAALLSTALPQKLDGAEKEAAKRIGGSCVDEQLGVALDTGVTVRVVRLSLTNKMSLNIS